MSRLFCHCIGTCLTGPVAECTNGLAILRLLAFELFPSIEHIEPDASYGLSLGTVTLQAAKNCWFAYVQWNFLIDWQNFRHHPVSLEHHVYSVTG